GADFGDFAAGGPGDEIEPVRADVGNGAEFPAEPRVEAPVPVVGAKQPVLKKAAVDEARFADLARGDARAHFLAERVVAKVVGDGADLVRFTCKVDKDSRFAGIESKRLFAEHVLARAQ